MGYLAAKPYILIPAFRGLSSHFLRVTAPWDELHSGYYGGAVREPF
jgi:hypothetical protein